MKNGKKATFRRGHGKRPKGPKGAEGGVDADSDHASAPHDDDEVSDHDPSDSEVGSYFKHVLYLMSLQKGSPIVFK